MSSDELGPVIEGDGPVAVYLALPPDVFPDAIDAIARIGLPHGSRLVFEKPFGDDLDSAIALNEQLRRCVPDDASSLDHHDVITGGSARSVRADEVEESWRVVQPFLDAWAADDVLLEEYPAGSTGP